MLYVVKAQKHPAPIQTTLDRVLGLFIAAAPTEAPTVIVAALTCCMLRLRSRGLQVLVPKKLQTIADVEVVCFDKTGTLTGNLVSY